MSLINPHHIVAMVPMRFCASLHFKFQDCVATWVDDDDPEEGYGDPPLEKGDYQLPQFSKVAGTVFGGTECDVYPAQFKLPGSEHESLRFYMSPKDVLDACVDAVRRERCPPGITEGDYQYE